ncbi:phosphopantetheine-binding protein [Sphingobium sufflavum]|uniref:acyl carrier protein n=1 Tax=Sphingobium sufflavum TaxID=1129547 RepID=UPI001F33DDF2|nr:phosphopantetheine-binding protein [Sphingobium sufflavum]MCE7797237.1 phosphopantetheine-binding protein [Sphingobium sufflavum]
MDSFDGSEALGFSADPVLAVDDAGPSVATLEAGVKSVLINVLRLEMSAADIDADTNIFELGADSMATVELVFALEEHFGIQFEEDMLKATMLENVGKITRLVAGKSLRA